MPKRLAAVLARLILILSLATLAAAFLAAGERYPILFWLAAGAAALKGFRRLPALWTRGTARLADTADLLRAGLLGDRGLIMGRLGGGEPPTLGRGVRMLLDPRVPSDLACQAALGAIYRRRWAAERMIRINDFCHVLTVAPPGKGKSVSVAVPNLLSYPGSVVAVDPKLELWSLTSRTRRDRLGHRVFLLNPYGLYDAPSDGFNPLDRRFIDPARPDFLSRCRDLANMLVVRSGEEREPHWNDSAELVITAFIAYVVACEPDANLRNLTTVRRLLSSPTAYARAVRVMQQVEGYWGVIALQGRLLQWFMDRELGSVMTTAQRHTAWIDDPQVAACLAHTTFQPELLRTGRVTIYLGLPHDKLVTVAGLMRTWLGCILRISTRGVPTERNPVLMLVDEAGHLGHMRALQDGITLMRGMGIRIWLFFQNLGQLRECYGQHAPIILGSMDTQQYFGLNDFETAEPVSKRIGMQTVLEDTESGGDGTSWPTGPGGREPQPGSRSTNSGWSRAPAERAVLQPSEILVLPERACLIFHKNLPCIRATLLRWYEAKEFRNGGTGTQRSAGLGAVLAAAVVLTASLVAVGAAAGGRPEAPKWGGLDTPGGWTFDLGGAAPPPPYRPVPPIEVGDAGGGWIGLGGPGARGRPPAGVVPPLPARGHRRRPAYPYRAVPDRGGPFGDGFSFWDPSTWSMGY